MVSEQKPSQVMDADDMTSDLDDDILDLLDVVEVGKGVAEGALENAEADFTANLDSMLDDLESQESEDMPFPDPTPVDHEVDLNESLDLPSMDDLDNLLAELGAEAPEKAEKSHDMLADGDDLDSEGASSGAEDTKTTITEALDEALSSLDELDALDEMSKPEAPEPLDFDDEPDEVTRLDDSASSDSAESVASDMADTPKTSDSSDSADLADSPGASDIADISNVFANFEAQNSAESKDTDDVVVSAEAAGKLDQSDGLDEADLLAEIAGQQGAGESTPDIDVSLVTGPEASPETSPKTLPETPTDAGADMLDDIFDAAVAKMESDGSTGQEGEHTPDDQEAGSVNAAEGMDAFDALQAAVLSDTPPSSDSSDSSDSPDTPDISGEEVSPRDDLPLDIEGLGTIEAPQDPFESAMAVAVQAKSPAAEQEAEVVSDTTATFDVAQADDIQGEEAMESSSTAVVGTRLDEDVNELDALLDEMLASPVAPAQAAEPQKVHGTHNAGQAFGEEIHDICERLDNLEGSPSTQQLFERCSNLEEAVAQKDEAIASLERSLSVQEGRMAELEALIDEQKTTLASMTTDMDKMVAAAAAKVIREEIAALIESLQGGE